MTLEDFICELKKLEINLTDIQLNQLNRYYELLIEWNEKVNLTRIVDKKDVYLKHFYDSITLIKAINLQKECTLCDVGTGAGFPGIVLKIVFPTLRVTLIDALQKRINFLNLVIEELKLDNIVAIHSRIEDYSKFNREKFDIVTSRAVANLALLSEISMPLVKVNGYFIPMKSSIEEELSDAKEIIKNVGGKIDDIIEFYLPFENSLRNLVVIKKFSITPKQYPRKMDKIKKKH